VPARNDISLMTRINEQANKGISNQQRSKQYCVNSSLANDCCSRVRAQLTLNKFTSACDVRTPTVQHLGTTAGISTEHAQHCSSSTSQLLYLHSVKRTAVGLAVGASVSTGAAVTGGSVAGGFVTGGFVTGAFVTGAAVVGAAVTGAAVVGAAVTGASVSATVGAAV
jgi:hypothetical protein